MTDFSDIKDEHLFICKTNMHMIETVRERLYRYALDGNIEAMIAFAKL